MSRWLDKMTPEFDLIAFLAILVGGVLWLGTLNERTAAGARDIEKIKVLEDQNSQQFVEIRERLIRIEDAVAK